MQETQTTSKLANAASLGHHALCAGSHAQGFQKKFNRINKIYRMNRIF
jgi:hypothetical protein